MRGTFRNAVAAGEYEHWDLTYTCRVPQKNKRFGHMEWGSYVKVGIDIQGAIDYIRKRPSSWKRYYRLKKFNFHGRDLSGLDFSHSDLRGADFSGCNLTGAVFDGAKIGGADFSRAIYAAGQFAGAQGTPKGLENNVSARRLARMRRGAARP